MRVAKWIERNRRANAALEPLVSHNFRDESPRERSARVKREMYAALDQGLESLQGSGWDEMVGEVAHRREQERNSRRFPKSKPVEAPADPVLESPRPHNTRAEHTRADEIARLYEAEILRRSADRSSREAELVDLGKRYLENVGGGKSIPRADPAALEAAMGFVEGVR